MNVLLVGLGNAYRGDDAVGLAVADSVRGRRLPVRVVACEEEPSGLIDAWDGADAVVIVDASCSGETAAGTVRRFDASSEAIPAGAFRFSTHAFGLGETIELARALGRLPQRVVVYGIEASSVFAGAALTPEVAAVVETVAAAVAAELERLCEEEPCTSAR